MRILLVAISFLAVWPAMAQAPMNNVSRTITENAVRSTTDAIGKNTAADQQKAEDARSKAVEDAGKQAGSVPAPSAVPATK
jgi:hypothetical protein